jgi:hypothetical protein
MSPIKSQFQRQQGATSGIKLTNQPITPLISLLVVIILIYLPTQGQSVAEPLNPKTPETFKELGNYSAIYYVPGSRMWTTFENLRVKASQTELLELCENSNPILRCYSYLALALDSNFDMFQILKNHLRDTSKVFILFGDEGYHQAVGDFFCDISMTEFIYANVSKISAEKQRMVDSLLLFDTEIKLARKTDLLLKIKPNYQYYDRIREMAIRENNNDAVVALSKFKNAQDIPLIYSLLQNPEREKQYLGLRAVRSFPDSSSFPVLEKIYNIELKRTGGFDIPHLRMLYQALVQYKDPRTKELLGKTLRIKDFWAHKENCNMLWFAIKKFPDPIFNDLLNKLKIGKYEIEELTADLKYVDN